MKKNYIAPAIKVKRIEVENSFLAASTETMSIQGSYGNDVEVLSKKQSVVWSDEEDNNEHGMDWLE